MSGLGRDDVSVKSGGDTSTAASEGPPSRPGERGQKRGNTDREPSNNDILEAITRSESKTQKDIQSLIQLAGVQTASVRRLEDRVLKLEQSGVGGNEQRDGSELQVLVKRGEGVTDVGAVKRLLWDLGAAAELDVSSWQLLGPRWGTRWTLLTGESQEERRKAQRTFLPELRDASGGWKELRVVGIPPNNEGTSADGGGGGAVPMALDTPGRAPPAAQHTVRLSVIPNKSAVEKLWGRIGYTVREAINRAGDERWFYQVCRNDQGAITAAKLCLNYKAGGLIVISGGKYPVPRLSWRDDRLTDDLARDTAKTIEGDLIGAVDMLDPDDKGWRVVEGF